MQNSNASLPIRALFEKVVTVRDTKGHWEGSSYVKVGLTGSWSRWGGKRNVSYINQWERTPENWFCQSCTNEIPMQISPYLFEYPEEEYIRVCAPCFHDNCPDLKKRSRK